MVKLNCWEFKKCGREPGGHKVDELGACPASTFEEYHGVHDGKRAGRACWAVPASLCSGQKQGVFCQKLDSCQQCDFFNVVKKEEYLGPHGFAQTPAVIRLYIRKRFNRVFGSSTEAGATVEPGHINEIERKYLFYAGYQGRTIIDSVFVDLGYKRGSAMKRGDFDKYLSSLLHSLPDNSRQEFWSSLDFDGIVGILDLRQALTA